MDVTNPFGARLASSGPVRSQQISVSLEAYLHKWLRSYETCVDRFLLPSQFVKTKLVENGWDAGKIEVLPHFQNLPAQRMSDPSPDAPILYFGRLSAEKGLADLLRAMPNLPAVRLQIAGEGPQRAELERHAADMDLPNVEFLGQVAGPHLHRLISTSRFTVLPSWAYETLGKTILDPTRGDARSWPRTWAREGNWCMRVKPASCSEQVTYSN